MAASVVALVWPCEQCCLLATLIHSINVQLSTLAAVVPKSLQCEALWKPRLYNNVDLNQENAKTSEASRRNTEALVLP